MGPGWGRINRSEYGAQCVAQCLHRVIGRFWLEAVGTVIVCQRELKAAEIQPVLDKIGRPDLWLLRTRYCCYSDAIFLSPLALCFATPLNKNDRMQLFLNQRHVMGPGSIH